MKRIRRVLINADGSACRHTFWGIVKMQYGFRVGFGIGWLELGNSCWGIYLPK